MDAKEIADYWSQAAQRIRQESSSLKGRRVTTDGFSLAKVPGDYYLEPVIDGLLYWGVNADDHQKLLAAHVINELAKAATADKLLLDLKYELQRQAFGAPVDKPRVVALIERVNDALKHHARPLPSAAQSAGGPCRWRVKDEQDEDLIEYWRRAFPPASNEVAAADIIEELERELAEARAIAERQMNDAEAARLELAEIKAKTKENSMKITDAMVDRFLQWPMPESVCADLCATKQQTGRVGTNLLTAIEARQMLEYVLADVAIGPVAEIVAERRRQVEQEGWSQAHDDEHDAGEMAAAAAAYALNASCVLYPANGTPLEAAPAFWMWDLKWWKPKDPRRDLVRAGALIVAELEKLDRDAKR